MAHGSLGLDSGRGGVREMAVRSTEVYGSGGWREGDEAVQEDEAAERLGRRLAALLVDDLPPEVWVEAAAAVTAAEEAWAHASSGGRCRDGADGMSSGGQSAQLPSPAAAAAEPPSQRVPPSPAGQLPAPTTVAALPFGCGYTFFRPATPAVGVAAKAMTSGDPSSPHRETESLEGAASCGAARSPAARVPPPPLAAVHSEGTRAEEGAKATPAAVQEVVEALAVASPWPSRAEEGSTPMAAASQDAAKAVAVASPRHRPLRAPLHGFGSLDLDSLPVPHRTTCTTKAYDSGLVDEHAGWDGGREVHAWEGDLLQHQAEQQPQQREGEDGPMGQTQLCHAQRPMPAQRPRLPIIDFTWGLGPGSVLRILEQPAAAAAAAAAASVAAAVAAAVGSAPRQPAASPRHSNPPAAFLATSAFCSAPCSPSTAFVAPHTSQPSRPSSLYRPGTTSLVEAAGPYCQGAPTRDMVAALQKGLVGKHQLEALWRAAVARPRAPAAAVRQTAVGCVVVAMAGGGVPPDPGPRLSGG